MGPSYSITFQTMSTKFQVSMTGSSGTTIFYSYDKHGRLGLDETDVHTSASSEKSVHLAKDYLIITDVIANVPDLY